MAFFGVEVEPNFPYLQRFNPSNESILHISMATLGCGKTIEESQLYVKVDDNKQMLVCSLTPKVFETVQLHFKLTKVQKVLFSVRGNRSIHIFGHYIQAAVKPKNESYNWEDIGDVDSPRSNYGDMVSEDCFNLPSTSKCPTLTDGDKEKRKRVLTKKVRPSKVEGCSHNKNI